MSKVNEVVKSQLDAMSKENKTYKDLTEAQIRLLKGNRQPHLTDQEIASKTYAELDQIMFDKLEPYRRAQLSSPTEKQIREVALIEKINPDTVRTYTKARCSEIIRKAWGHKYDDKNKAEWAAKQAMKKASNS